MSALRAAAANAERYLRAMNRHGVLPDAALDEADALRAALASADDGLDVRLKEVR